MLNFEFVKRLDLCVTVSHVSHFLSIKETLCTIIRLWCNSISVLQRAQKMKTNRESETLTTKTINAWIMPLAVVLVLVCVQISMFIQNKESLCLFLWDVAVLHNSDTVFVFLLIFLLFLVRINFIFPVFHRSFGFFYSFRACKCEFDHHLVSIFFIAFGFVCSLQWHSIWNSCNGFYANYTLKAQVIYLYLSAIVHR